MTQFDEKAYVQSDGSSCPFCGTVEDWNVQGTTHEGSMIMNHVVCKNQDCEAEITEVYTMTSAGVDVEPIQRCGHCGGQMSGIMLGDEVGSKCFDCGYATMS